MCDEESLENSILNEGEDQVVVHIFFNCYNLNAPRAIQIKQNYLNDVVMRKHDAMGLNSLNIDRIPPTFSLKAAYTQLQRTMLNFKSSFGRC